MQGVDYDASIGGYLIGGSPSGAAQFEYLANYAVQKCPETQLVLSGYSQGAQVVHNGAARLGNDVTDKVVAVVLFGDPYVSRLTHKSKHLLMSERRKVNRLRISRPLRSTPSALLET